MVNFLLEWVAPVYTAIAFGSLPGLWSAGHCKKCMVLLAVFWPVLLIAVAHDELREGGWID